MHNLLILLLLLFRIVHAAPVDQPTFEPGVLYLPDRAIALGKKKAI